MPGKEERNGGTAADEVSMKTDPWRVTKSRVRNAVTRYVRTQRHVGLRSQQEQCLKGFVHYNLKCRKHSKKTVV